MHESMCQYRCTGLASIDLPSQAVCNVSTQKLVLKFRTRTGFCKLTCHMWRAKALTSSFASLEIAPYKMLAATVTLTSLWRQVMLSCNYVNLLLLLFPAQHSQLLLSPSLSLFVILLSFYNRIYDSYLCTSQFSLPSTRPWLCNN